mgnify:CR=1 FL=1
MLRAKAGHCVIVLIWTYNKKGHILIPTRDTFQFQFNSKVCYINIQCFNGQIIYDADWFLQIASTLQNLSDYEELLNVTLVAVFGLSWCWLIYSDYLAHTPKWPYGSFKSCKLRHVSVTVGFALRCTTYWISDLCNCYTQRSLNGYRNTHYHNVTTLPSESKETNYDCSLTPKHDLKLKLSVTQTTTWCCL